MTTHFATTVYHIKKKIWKKKKNSNNAFDLSGFHQYCHCTANQPEIFRFSRIKLLRGYFYKLPFIFIHIRNSTDRKVQNSILRIFYKRVRPSVKNSQLLPQENSFSHKIYKMRNIFCVKMQTFSLLSCQPVFLYVNVFVWFSINFSVCLIF